MVGNANANGVPFIKNGTSFLKDNIILWYDLKKQGATNENMANNPILKDLSGNGHDATCYNFAWSGMSGIGGYTEDFKNEWYNLETEGTIDMWSHDSFVLTSTAGHNTASIIYTNRDNITLKFKVSGLTEGDIIINQRNPFERVLTITEDGIYEVQLNRCGITSSTQRDSCNIKIELLPEYSNALVSDGVDDYCIVDGLPILTDYTVIAKRKWIKTEYDTFATFSSKSDSTTNGEFIFERFNRSGNPEVYSFGVSSSVTFAEDITYQAPTSYNGRTIKKGNLLGNDRLSLFALRGTAQFSNIALYSFVLFNRTLTEDEIKKWVRINMDKDYLLDANKVN